MVKVEVKCPLSYGTRFEWFWCAYANECYLLWSLVCVHEGYSCVLQNKISKGWEERLMRCPNNAWPKNPLDIREGLHGMNTNEITISGTAICCAPLLGAWWFCRTVTILVDSHIRSLKFCGLHHFKSSTNRVTQDLILLRIWKPWAHNIQVLQSSCIGKYVFLVRVRPFV